VKNIIEMNFRILKSVYLIIPVIISLKSLAQLTLQTPNVESILYLGSNYNQPLIVGLGGSEGGNAWASDYWKDTREQFVEKGYAFLAIGYFKAKNTPDTLNKIAIEDIYNAIKVATHNSKISKKKIAIIGGSGGADLALLLASYYKEIDCVVSIVGSNAVFPGHTIHFSTSCWTFKSNELPFVPVNDAAIPYLMKRDLRSAFETMLKDTIATNKAAIKIENINGPILFLSASNDEICPSTQMAESMIERLKTHRFKHIYKHYPIEGGHTEPLKHFNLIFQFFEANFSSKKL
jgi:dienelactone hydrolase